MQRYKKYAKRLDLYDEYAHLKCDKVTRTALRLNDAKNAGLNDEETSELGDYLVEHAREAMAALQKLDENIEAYMTHRGVHDRPAAS